MEYIKEQFQIEKEVVIEMTKTEERINLDALVYNLIRLHNIKQEIKNTTEDLEDFCESTFYLKPIKTRCNNILKKSTYSFGGYSIYFQNINQFFLNRYTVYMKIMKIHINKINIHQYCLNVFRGGLWSEKEQGLIEQITESVKGEFRNIVQEELKKQEGTTNGTEHNNEEIGGNVVKSITPEQIGEMISKSVTDIFGDFEEKFFKNLDDVRTPEPHVNLENNNVNNEPPIQKNVFSTTETAKMLMKKQRNNNPLIDAVINNL